MLEGSQDRTITLSFKLINLAVHHKEQAELPLHAALNRVAEQVDAITSEAKYLMFQMDDNIELGYGASDTIAWYTVLESAIILAATVGQVCCIRGLFGVKKGKRHLPR
jgi:hypothetical protein